MEASTVDKDQENSKIAGSAAALFGDSFEQSPFDTLVNEQTTTEYSSYYEYNDNTNALQDTGGTVTNSAETQQHDSATGYDYYDYNNYDYSNYYGGQYASGNTEGVNSTQEDSTQYQHDY